MSCILSEVKVKYPVFVMIRSFVVCKSSCVVKVRSLVLFYNGKSIDEVKKESLITNVMYFETN